MPLQVDVQIVSGAYPGITIPDHEQIQQWANQAVAGAGGMEAGNKQMTVRVVSEEEITQLNSLYRHKNKATNVLSFPFVAPPGIPEEESIGLLGDLVICGSVVNREASEQHKSVVAHWAHMVVHGTLHLLGYDHQHDREAEEMELLETAVLAKLGFDDPYK